MSAGLDASTVTPGSTPPRSSVISPAIELCAWAYAEGSRERKKRQTKPTRDPHGLEAASHGQRPGCVPVSSPLRAIVSMFVNP